MSINETKRIYLTNALQQNDRNGCWSDDAAKADGVRPLTLSEARECAAAEGLDVAAIELDAEERCEMARGYAGYR